MSLKNKIIGAVLASALVAPPAFAVEGSDGMHYTSASEGFYASIRVRFSSGAEDGDNASLANQSSRLGIQGTSEMSHGLEGFYRYETAFDVDDGSQGFGNARLGYVGLRGGFGSVRVGSDWSDEYNFVYGSTDIANVNSGNFAYNEAFPGRGSRSVYYKSPDFNGLQVGARFEVDGGSDDGRSTAQAAMGTVDAINDIIASGVLATVTADGLEMLGKQVRDEHVPDAELDSWGLSAKYEFSGFKLAGTYTTTPDYDFTYDIGASAITVNPELEDLTAWAIGGSYGQDNWNVATWYGQNNLSDFAPQLDDETVFSIAGNISIGKSGVYVVHETRENAASQDDAATAFGVEYKFNSKSKTWIEYAGRDYDSDSDQEDSVTIGLRHDF